MLTRAHAKLIRLSGGRIQRSYIFTGGLPILVLTTIGRKSGKSRSTPVGFIRYGDGFAVLASNAGSDHTPAWWLNLQARPHAKVLANRAPLDVTARRADATEEAALWNEFASLNPGFDEYRRLTARPIPVVVLEPQHPVMSRRRAHQRTPSWPRPDALSARPCRRAEPRPAQVHKPSLQLNN